jgi:hypothetical protein
MTTTHPPGLERFWKSLTNFSAPMEAGTVVRLDKGVNILADSSVGSVIYVRPCYPALLALCMTMVEIPETPHLIILGNPGIGKTYFGYFLLFHLARQGATVVYERGRKNMRYLFSPQLIARGGLSDFTETLDDPATFYIVDASKPVDALCKVILLSSPRRDVWYSFSKVLSAFRYMSVWSREEIQQCRALVYPNISGELANELFDKWGGVARFVLQYAHEESQQSLLTKALSSADLDTIIKCIGESDASNEVAHRLVHMHVGSNFMTTTYRFASDYVLDTVYQELYKTKRQKLLTFMSVSHGIAEFAQLRGQLFERHAHAVLARGGPFRTRSLETNTEKTLALEPLSELLFDTDEQVATSTNAYLRPRRANYASIDSLIKPNLLFQMTVGTTHPCKQAGLRDVLNLLGNPTEPHLYFVVPDDCFQEFTHQSYQDSQNKILRKPTFSNVKKIRQFVLTINLSSDHQ